MDQLRIGVAAPLGRGNHVKPQHLLSPLQQNKKGGASAEVPPQEVVQNTTSELNLVFAFELPLGYQGVIRVAADDRHLFYHVPPAAGSVRP